MNRPKIIHRSNYVEHYTYHSDEEGVPPVLMIPGEVNQKPSETVPGKEMTIQEILKRYTSGQDVRVHEAVWDAHEMLPDNFERMDQIERIELLRRVQSIVVDRQGRLQRRKLERERQGSARTDSAGDSSSEQNAPLGDGGGAAAE